MDNDAILAELRKDAEEYAFVSGVHLKENLVEHPASKQPDLGRCFAIVVWGIDADDLVDLKASKVLSANCAFFEGEFSFPGNDLPELKLLLRERWAMMMISLHELAEKECGNTAHNEKAMIEAGWLTQEESDENARQMKELFGEK